MTDRNIISALDYPDPDVIRVGNTYYMVSTTMHFMPGCELLRSYDLVHWEHMSYVYTKLDSTPSQKLEDGNIFGKGMWAASLRYHDGIYYICFVCNDTHRTYLYTSADIKGPWEKHFIEGFYHDCSLFFDDDGRKYIIYGNREVYITELDNDLSKPKKGGLHRILVNDKDNKMLGYEGSHFYKIDGRYYLFLIHSKSDRWFRCEACFSSDSLEGEFAGGDCFSEENAWCGQGAAQGGIVDTPDGKWYAILFRDSGAVGRRPVLLPVEWDGKRPVFGRNGHIPETFDVPSDMTGHEYLPLTDSDDFKKSYNEGYGLKPCWQFSHEPDEGCFEHDTENGIFSIRTASLSSDLLHAKNVLTQRMTYPTCYSQVTVDVTGLNEGDYAGICAYQGCYAFAAVTIRNSRKYLVMISEGAEKALVPFDADKIALSLRADFTDMKDTVRFYYSDSDNEIPIGDEHKLYFRLDHFCGCRTGLFIFSTHRSGGRAGFENFIMN